ncbi:MAG TPA: enoyl-CoA hydratase-related protein [Pyrinomonadaceae bacterium]|jgi:enoyl-CoA hydratase|nr:enoyl-CoA hydratase-related protein [Pyrinomonadaceae bacterium]
MSSLILERTPTYAIIHLNRPEKLNALSCEMLDALNAEVGKLEPDQQLRTLILTGEGERAFCTGTDISELNEGGDGSEISHRGQQLCDRIENFPVPVIAAINGIAAGGGLELALACHLRIAATEAAFSLPETQLGLMPGYGGTQRLTRELGVGRGLEMMLTGRMMTSDEALEFGLVNRVVPQAAVLSEAISLAEEISRLSPLSIRACLKAVIQGLDLPLEDGLKLETELFASLFNTVDAREGTSAFLEKRKPVFKGW